MKIVTILKEDTKISVVTCRHWEASNTGWRVIRDDKKNGKKKVINGRGSPQHFYRWGGPCVQSAY